MDEAWSAVRDALLRGLTHALSNRVMAITTLAELATESPMAATTGNVLSSEARRLDDLLRQLRLLSPTLPAAPEALNVADMIAPLVDLAGRHPEVVGTPCDLSVASGTQPAFADPGELGRIVPALVVAAARAARRVQGARVRIEVLSDAQSVLLRVTCGQALAADVVPGPQSADSPTIRIAETPESARYELRLPSLAAARRGMR